MLNFVPKSKRRAQKIAKIFGKSIKETPKQEIKKKEDNIPDFFKEKSKKYDSFPISLKIYIQKCFANCDSDKSRLIMSDKLLNKIASAVNKGLVQTHNWVAESIIELNEPNKEENIWLRLTQKPAEFKTKTIEKAEKKKKKVKKEEKAIKKNDAKKNLLLSTSLDDLSKISLPLSNEKQNGKTISEKFLINPPKKTKISRDMSFEDIIEKNKIVGTCMNLEKQYIRITTVEPDPAMFRPENILKKSLKYCLRKYRESNNYEYIRDQLRSIRQDLVVQDIEDMFSVKVYETVARLAIQHSDWDNFNQSLNPLEKLYADGLGKPANIAEISSYKIVYLAGYKDTTGFYTFVPRLNSETINSNDVKFAIEVWKSINSGSWRKFFHLKKNATPLMRNVMDISSGFVRADALNKIRKSFRHMSLDEYREVLCFDTIEETKKYLDDREIQLPVR